MKEETKYEIKCNEYKKRDAKLRSEEESIKNQTKIDNIIKEEGRGGAAAAANKSHRGHERSKRRRRKRRT